MIHLDTHKTVLKMKVLFVCLFALKGQRENRSNSLAGMCSIIYFSEGKRQDVAVGCKLSAGNGVFQMF